MPSGNRIIMDDWNYIGLTVQIQTFPLHIVHNIGRSRREGAIVFENL